MPKSKFSRVKLKAYGLTNRKFVFLLFTECIFVNDGGELRFSKLLLKFCQGKKSFYSAFLKQIKISL